MSNTIETLLLRNLQDVFGEGDTRVSTSSLPVTARFQPFTSSSTPHQSEAGR
jgi:hypothetical protein